MSSLVKYVLFRLRYAEKTVWAIYVDVENIREVLTLHFVVHIFCLFDLILWIQGNDVLFPQKFLYDKYN